LAAVILGWKKAFGHKVGLILEPSGLTFVMLRYDMLKEQGNIPSKGFVLQIGSLKIKK
jgi:hypothetical protein